MWLPTYRLRSVGIVTAPDSTTANHKQRLLDYTMYQGSERMRDVLQAVEDRRKIPQCLNILQSDTALQTSSGRLYIYSLSLEIQ